MKNEELPSLIDESFEDAKNDTLPDKSKDRYERIYNEFAQWRNSNNMEQYSERVVLAYFKDLSKRYNPGSLWPILSMLKATLKLKHNVDIYKYRNVMAFVKKIGDSHTPKKSEVFTSDQINTFLREADDETHLFTKVVLVIGISGCCRRCELLNILTTDIEDLHTKLLIKLVDAKTKQSRMFIVPNSFYPIVKKYWKLRPENTDNARFFINYQKGKCTKQVVGINKMGSVPRKIAEFLKLPNAANYTGHSLRRTSTTVLVDSDGDVTQLKRNGRLRSVNVAESDIAHSMRIRGEIAEAISSTNQDDSVDPSASRHQEEPTNTVEVQGLNETIVLEDMESNGPSTSRHQEELTNTLRQQEEEATKTIELIETIKQEDVEIDGPSTSRLPEEPTDTIELQELIAKTKQENVDINKNQSPLNDLNIVVNDITKVKSADFKGFTFNNCTIHFHNFHNNSK